MPEWSKGDVLRTSGASLAGSNPALSNPALKNSGQVST